MTRVILEKNHAQVDTDLGILSTWQVNNSETFIIEIFQPNQTVENVIKNRFINVWNLFYVADNMDFVSFRRYPKEWTWKQLCDMEQEAVQEIYKMLGTIQNLEDLKEVTYLDGGHLVQGVYESLKCIRNIYNDKYCSHCGRKPHSHNIRHREDGRTFCKNCFDKYLKALVK